MSNELINRAINLVNHYCLSCPKKGPNGCSLKDQEAGLKFFCYEIKRLRAAIDKPLRNCDVGTPEEQWKRFDSFCGGYPCNCDGCPFEPDGLAPSGCALMWAQMPYGEGEGSEEHE